MSMSENEHKLHQAAKSGDTAEITRLIALGTDVNSQDATGDTALNWAAYHGQFNAVKELIDNDANLNKADKKGRTPLFWAAQKGHLKTLKELLLRGANSNVKTKSGKTPFRASVYSENNPHIKCEFMERGYILQEGDQKRLNAALISAASKEEHDSLIERLISVGADVTSVNNYGDTALHRAAHYGKNHIVKTLIEKGANLDAVSHGKTPLIYAIECCQLETASLLLSKGAKAEPYVLKKLLSKAPHQHHPRIMCETIEKGYVFDIEDQKRLKYALRTAAEEGQHELIQRLISVGADVNSVNFYGETPLIYAICRGHSEAVKTLIDKSADINLADKKGMSPLAWAAIEGQSQIFDLLIEKGADIHQPVLGDLTLIEAIATYRTADIRENKFRARCFDRLLKMGVKFPISLTSYNTDISWTMRDERNRVIKVVKSFLEVNKAILRQDWLFGWNTRIGRTLALNCELYPELFDDTLQKKHYKIIVDTLEKRFNKEGEDFKLSGKGSEKSKALNELFKIVLHKSLIPEPALSIEEKTAPVEEREDEGSLPAPSAPRLSTMIKTPTDERTSPDEHAGVGISPEQYARELALRNLTVSTHVINIPSEATTDTTQASLAAVAGAGNGTGACATYYEQKSDSYFEALKARAEFSEAFSEALPMASTSKPEVPAAGDLLEWYQREVAKQTEQAEQTARDLRATQTAIVIPQELATLDFSAAQTPAQSTSLVHPGSAHVFSTAEPVIASPSCQDLTETSPASVSTPLFSSDFPEAPKDALPLQRQASEQSVDLLTFA